MDILPRTYRVEIYRGKDIITAIEIKTTNEEEAVVQAVKQLNTKVKRL